MKKIDNKQNVVYILYNCKVTKVARSIPRYSLFGFNIIYYELLFNFSKQRLV